MHYIIKSPMKIIVDEREITLYDKMNSIIIDTENKTSNNLGKMVLTLGDIAILTDDDVSVCIIERKSLTDLLASIKDGRYEEQSHRLLHASQMHPHNIIYIIEGLITQLRSAAEKKMVYSAITSLNLFKGFSVLRTNSVQETAELILAMSDKISRNYAKNISLAMNIQLNQNNSALSNLESTIVNSEPINEVISSQNTTNYVNFVKKVKKDNITPENIGEIILSQIPGISSITAIAIMKTYSTFPKLMDAIRLQPDCLNTLTCETASKTGEIKSRKISKACIENIKKFLL